MFSPVETQFSLVGVMFLYLDIEMSLKLKIGTSRNLSIKNENNSQKQYGKVHQRILEKSGMKMVLGKVIDRSSSLG
ncbi:hypothetical protein CH352_04615 [Leptospira hartskeerlii]|uniref:Uncharacterized protein n=1 Tax=Leptospira hartskeerlii TaxID=2023177 RepID=A0A2M9XFZ6_9LEPT|nr:hypothetical protein CH357_03840 [Leptospira hartskeerlii]PJZ34882.1 hypothetical protein CH352_04615 [Leptospira hartskeerlii]